MSTSMLDWAIHYAQQDLSVVPVDKNTKQPSVLWKEWQISRPSIQNLTQWFKKWPDADVGIITGPISNRLIVDFDGPKGMETFNKNDWPLTPLVKTRKGVQLHFKWDNRLLEVKTTLVKPFLFEMPGVDFRGKGGYTKMVPSLFSDSSGRYTWVNGEETPLTECPEWIIQLLLTRKEKNDIQRIDSNESWLQEKLNNLHEGNRNDTFTSIAGSLRSRGYTATDIFDLLSPHASLVTFPLDELETICNSIGTYTPKVENSSTSTFIFKTDAEKYLDELKERAKKLEPEFCTGFPSLDRLTKGFPRQNIYVIGAPTNGGKTQFVLSNILALLKKGKKVLYFSTEMPQSEIRDRFNALGARIPIEELTSGFLKKENREKLLHFLTEFDTSKFIIAPEDTPTLDNVKNALETIHPDIIILDHMHHIKMKTDNRRTEIDDFIMGFKKLILQYNIPGIITAQLRRKEGQDGGIPHYTMHDFKESGGIENEAGVCVLLCPPGEWTTERIQHVTAYIPKNRHGRREVRFSLNFDTEIAEFKEPEYAN